MEYHNNRGRDIDKSRGKDRGRDRGQSYKETQTSNERSELLRSESGSSLVEFFN